MTWHEERERLLRSPINELNLSIAGSALEPLVHQLYDELEQTGLGFRPPVYLSDEWGCPEGVPVIGVPFYLASPGLSKIEEEIAENLETPLESMQYLRHEAGHAFNYAYLLYELEDWHRVFGPYARPYIENYKANPFSRNFVRHIAGWYAQKHPDEDFAETFAVWLTPGSSWRETYAGTGALMKLEYVDELLERIGTTAPRITAATRDVPVEDMRFTVGNYYERREEPRVEVPRWFDGDLKQLFGTEGSPAEPLLRRRRLDLLNEVAYWTGVQPSVIRPLIDHLIDRVRELNLMVPASRSERCLVSFTAMVTTLALNHLHHGSFAP